MASSTQKETCLADGALVGTKALLDSSPNVTQPTVVNRPIPVPSIYKDGRGEIHNILVGAKRINLLFTKKGVMRSGDIHVNTQHDFVFEGSVEVWLLQENGSTVKQTYNEYQYIRVPPFVPHIFHFLEDTCMAEWWEPEPFETWFYTPYRRLVEQSFDGTRIKGNLVKLSESTNSLLWTTTVAGVVVGLLLGIMIGRRK
jgi:hypothetical protein